ncbi:GLUG motif-containing protein, partial [Lysinibacillus sp. NPDC059133]|uniref:GLUG motif-containing protein n=1 Tax=Lysinibacillus sp. NPDC059133 TaxID=3346737 RepID=UPI0036859E61
DSNVGGFVGYMNGGVIKKSYATDAVKGSSYVGGFVGYMSSGTIEQCYATGNVDGTSYLGGFAGYLSGSNSVIRNSFSLGNVAAGRDTAGFVGYLSSGKVENSYSTASNTNGFHNNGTVTNSYFDSTISGNMAKAEGRATADMKKAATYTGWNFESIWEIDEGYPILQGLKTPEMDVGNYTEIKTAEDLVNINKDLFGMYRLMADIDLKDVAWTPIGTATVPFAGVLDGNGHSIKNLNLNLTAQDYVGLLGYSKGTIMNLKIEGAEVKGKNYVGVLAGYSKGNVTDVTVDGVTALSGTSYIGGLVGSSAGDITGSVVSEVTALSSSSQYAGGLVGYSTGNISDIKVNGIGTLNGSSYVGGLAGYSNGIIK